MNQEQREFIRSLSREERLLVRVRDVIYEGDWSEVERDLQARLSGGPYILTLASRIEDDLKRIERLKEFEAKNGVDAGVLLDLLGAEEGTGSKHET